MARRNGDILGLLARLSELPSVPDSNLQGEGKGWGLPGRHGRERQSAFSRHQFVQSTSACITGPGNPYCTDAHRIDAEPRFHQSTACAENLVFSVESQKRAP
jgi:hypothetical protein